MDAAGVWSARRRRRTSKPKSSQPIRAWRARRSTRAPSSEASCFRGRSRTKSPSAYRKHLFGDATLQDLPPDPPRFVINATSVQTGALFRFSRPFIADYRVGTIPNPTIELAVAVAASSAFPPVLSPLTRARPGGRGHQRADCRRRISISEPFLIRRRAQRRRRLRQPGPRDCLEALQTRSS